MDWDGLQVFLAVARAGRMSTAARRLDVEHTTVSRRLAALEADLGVPLFYRTATGYVLTPHGHNVLSSAEIMEGAAIAVAAHARRGGARRAVANAAATGSRGGPHRAHDHGAVRREVAGRTLPAARHRTG